MIPLEIPEPEWRQCCVCGMIISVWTSSRAGSGSISNGMNDRELAQQIEGLLFALGKPLSRADCLTFLHIDASTLERALDHVREHDDRGMVLVDDGAMLELRVAPEVAELVEKLRKEEQRRDIGRAGLEVLAAVLYRGPLTRSEIDFIRGVNSSQTLRTLTMRGLVRKLPNPKDERSFLYEATSELFAALGATSARDLPDFDSVRSKLTELEETYRASQSA